MTSIRQLVEQYTTLGLVVIPVSGKRPVSVVLDEYGQPLRRPDGSPQCAGNRSSSDSRRTLNSRRSSGSERPASPWSSDQPPGGRGRISGVSTSSTSPAAKASSGSTSTSRSGEPGWSSRQAAVAYTFTS
jgi:hypothetical protein